MWIDVGVNLTNRAFADDLPEVVARARAKGLKLMMAVVLAVVAVIYFYRSFAA